VKTSKVYVVRQEMSDGTIEWCNEYVGWVPRAKDATKYNTRKTAKALADACRDPPSAGRVHIAVRRKKVMISECIRCCGTGFVPVFGRDVKCHICNGRGEDEE